MLTSFQQTRFLNKIYEFPDNNYADYNFIKNSKKNIATSGWMHPHVDNFLDNDSEIFTFQVEYLNPEFEQCLVHNKSDDNIILIKLEIGFNYSFLFEKTHALLPFDIADVVVRYQNFNHPVINNWIKDRDIKGFKEPAQMAWFFLD